MPTAVIVDAVRTPLGRRNGKLKDVHPVDLAAHVLEAIVERNDLDPALVEDVIMGCVMQVGEQGINIARNAALAAGFPESTVGTTVDRQCGSSQQAAHFAAQGVIAGAYDVVIAAGVENMTRVPMGASVADGKYGFPFGPMMTGALPEPRAAGHLGRADLREVGHHAASRTTRSRCESHQRAARATRGRPLRPRDPARQVTTDDGEEIVRAGRGHPARLDHREARHAEAGVQARRRDHRRATRRRSPTARPRCSIMSEEKANQLGLKPRARFHTFALAGVDPVMMLTGPIPATTKVLERAKMTLDQIDLVEINEAFAPVVLAWEKEHHPDMAKVNVNGGAIALGHPLGCSGARLMATLLNELERTGGRYGLQTMCEGGGMANATIIERL